MFKCEIENINHEILTLTQNESEYQVMSITGLNPPNAQINRSTVAGMDGTKFNSSKLNERAITIILKLNGDVEKTRIKKMQLETFISRVIVKLMKLICLLIMN